MSKIVTAVVTAAALASFSPAAESQNLLSCEVQEIRSSGDGPQVVYGMSCRPVDGGNVTEVRTATGGEIEVTYGAGSPVLGGGPIYILRYSTDPGDRTHYGPALDGNIGTAGR
jgi:hypothetical protein